MLIAHWTFDIGTIDGREVADVQGGPAATLDESVRIVPGRDGEALSFGGAGHAVVPAVPQLVLSQAFGFALAFHVKVTAAPDGEWRGLFAKPAGEHDARSAGMWLYPDATRVRTQLFTIKGPDYVDSRRALPLDEWAHVAFVVNSDGMFLYIDGQLDVAVPLEHAVVPLSGPLYLGSEPGKPGLTGLLADFRVYASALDEATIHSLAQA
ncbi:LamG domain-containing protein [Spirillospora sp. NPDC029432]|uniref:LamG domain-containing protein n=1 Tax=Spirillospora sp. NPDC029432 TaxID=3154599 RepID=UPI00345277F8